MMAAMMLPSGAPVSTAYAHGRLRPRPFGAAKEGRVALLVAGYLLGGRPTDVLPSRRSGYFRRSAGSRVPLPYGLTAWSSPWRRPISSRR
ncbi:MULTISPECIES: hypothetical protein [unclassified Arthrobacter]|uniref:hypothetical protein n=1 Tax=unclassified Arthrobacter TaxID=235627 RepID=UPI00339A0D73